MMIYMTHNYDLVLYVKYNQWVEITVVLRQPKFYILRDQRQKLGSMQFLYSPYTLTLVLQRRRRLCLK